MQPTRTPFLLLSLLPTLAALPPQGDPGSAAPKELPSWRIPFHAGADARESWAAGPGFKVRVDDGVTFFPRLGAAAPAHQALRWRTEDVRVDGKSTLTAGRPGPKLQLGYEPRRPAPGRQPRHPAGARRQRRTQLLPRVPA